MPAPSGASAGLRPGQLLPPLRDGEAGIRWRVVLLLVAAHLVLTVPLAVALNFWKDEAFSLYTTSAGLADAFDRAVHFELQPPLYFVLLWGWRQVSGEPVFARLFSVLCGALTLPVVAALARRAVPRVSPLWVTAAVAFSPFFVWAALETRVYAFALLLQALLLLTFHDAFLARHRSGRAQAAFTVAAVALVYTQYYSGFLLPACALGLLVSRRWIALRDYLLTMVVVALCMLPIVGWIHGQTASHVGSAAAAVPVDSYIFHYLVQRIEQYILPVEALLYEGGALTPAAATVLHWGARLLLLAGMLYAVARGGGPAAWWREPRNRWLAAAAALLTVAFAGLYFAVGEDLLTVRHTVALYFPALLLVAALLGASGSDRLMGIWCVASVGCAGLVLLHEYRPLAKAEDSERVAAYLTAHQRPGEPVLVFPSDNVVSLSLYYPEPGRLVGLPRPFPMVGFEAATMAVRDTVELGAALRALGEPASVWYVSKPVESYLGVDYRHDLLEQFLLGRYRAVSEQPFHGGIRVRHLLQR